MAAIKKPSWPAGDKAGASAGDHNAINDVAIAWPPGGPPMISACYMSESIVDADARNAAQVGVATIVAQPWGA